MKSCIRSRFEAKSSSADLTSLGELDDLRHLHAHNYAGEADDKFFGHRHRRHVLVGRTSVSLSCGAIFDGVRVNLAAEHLRFYAAVARRALERFQ